MIKFLQKIFGKSSSPGVAELIKNGAVIIDVRTVAEYRQGHLKNSLNIPLDELKNKMVKLDKSKPVITCCASGMRSGAAKRTLLSHGFSVVQNGGSWTSLKKYL